MQRSLRDRRNLRKPARYCEYETDESFSGEDESQFAMIGEIQDVTVNKALKDVGWRKAMQEEYDSLMKMETWSLVKLPRNARGLTCRWVLRQKPDGQRKARLVVRGFEQIELVDYSDTFSPVARHTSIRLLLSLVD